MKKNLILIPTLMCLLIGLSQTVKAYDVPIDILVNDKFIKTDTSPFLENGITYVPIRFVSNALGCDKVEWNKEENTVTIIKDKTDIKLKIGDKTAYIDGVATKLEKPPKIVSDRTYLPVRWISEALGAKVDWLSDYNAVKLDTTSTVPEDSINTSYTTDDILWLGRIIDAESSGEILKGKIGVGNVILNRVESNQYPNTIYGVIFDKENGVQFQPTSNGTIYNTPTKESFNAAKLVLNGYDEVDKCLFFLNPRISTNFWIVNNRPFFTKIGNHDFYL